MARNGSELQTNSRDQPLVAGLGDILCSRRPELFLKTLVSGLRGTNRAQSKKRPVASTRLFPPKHESSGGVMVSLMACCVWVADFAGLCRNLPMEGKYLLCFPCFLNRRSALRLCPGPPAHPNLSSNRPLHM